MPPPPLASQRGRRLRSNGRQGLVPGDDFAPTGIDELAVKLGMDPIEFRLKNSVREGSENINGTSHGNIGAEEVLRAARLSSRSERVASILTFLIYQWPDNLTPQYLPSVSGCICSPRKGVVNT
jgi:hypothetical protein